MYTKFELSNSNSKRRVYRETGCMYEPNAAVIVEKSEELADLYNEVKNKKD